MEFWIYLVINQEKNIHKILHAETFFFSSLSLKGTVGSELNGVVISVSGPIQNLRPEKLNFCPCHQMSISSNLNWRNMNLIPNIRCKNCNKVKMLTLPGPLNELLLVFMVKLFHSMDKQSLELLWKVNSFFLSNCSLQDYDFLT